MIEPATDNFSRRESTASCRHLERVEIERVGGWGMWREWCRQLPRLRSHSAHHDGHLVGVGGIGAFGPQAVRNQRFGGGSAGRAVSGFPPCGCR